MDAIQGITQTIREINEIDAAAVSAGVEEQSSATQEIARSVEQASAGTQNVSATISNVTQGAGETGQASHQLLSAADNLSQQAEALRSRVHDTWKKSNRPRLRSAGRSDSAGGLRWKPLFYRYIDRFHEDVDSNFDTLHESAKFKYPKVRK